MKTTKEIAADCGLDDIQLKSLSRHLLDHFNNAHDWILTPLIRKLYARIEELEAQAIEDVWSVEEGPESVALLNGVKRTMLAGDIRHKRVFNDIAVNHNITQPRYRFGSGGKMSAEDEAIRAVNLAARHLVFAEARVMEETLPENWDTNIGDILDAAHKFVHETVDRARTEQADAADLRRKPQCCPHCGSMNVVNCVEWTARSADPTDPENVATLVEYQCRMEACSRSFWV